MKGGGRTGVVGMVGQRALLSLQLDAPTRSFTMDP